MTAKAQVKPVAAAFALAGSLSLGALPAIARLEGQLAATGGIVLVAIALGLHRYNPPARWAAIAGISCLVILDGLLWVLGGSIVVVGERKVVFEQFVSLWFLWHVAFLSLGLWCLRILTKKQVRSLFGLRGPIAA